jgi:hypothetical protein
MTSRAHIGAHTNLCSAMITEASAKLPDMSVKSALVIPTCRNNRPNVILAEEEIYTFSGAVLWPRLC